MSRWGFVVSAAKNRLSGSKATYAARIQHMDVVRGEALYKEVLQLPRKSGQFRSSQPNYTILPRHSHRRSTVYSCRSEVRLIASHRPMRLIRRAISTTSRSFRISGDGNKATDFPEKPFQPKAD